MSHLTGKIKTTLRTVSSPKLSYRLKIPEKLTDAHRYIVAIKETHRKEFNPVKVNVNLLQVCGNIPQWLDPLSSILQLYLDVKIIKTSAILDDTVCSTYSIIGHDEDVLIANKYIDYLYTAVLLLTEVKRWKVSNKNRKSRRSLKRINIKISHKDAREVSSEFRDTLLDSIMETLNHLLDSLKNDENEAYTRSVAKQEKLTNYLVQKYSKAWKEKLSNN